MQKRARSNQYVTLFTVEYSDDGTTWSTVDATDDPSMEVKYTDRWPHCYNLGAACRMTLANCKARCLASPQCNGFSWQTSGMRGVHTPDLDGQVGSGYLKQRCVNDGNRGFGRSTHGYFEKSGPGHGFAGPTRSNSVEDEVDAMFYTPVTARFIKIMVQSWESWVSMRAALIVETHPPSPPASPPLDFSILDPPEWDRTYSSVWRSDPRGKGHARSRLDSQQAWSALRNEVGQWMTMDAGKDIEIYGVRTRKRFRSGQHVSQFTVEQSSDGAASQPFFTTTWPASRNELDGEVGFSFHVSEGAQVRVHGLGRAIPTGGLLESATVNLWRAFNQTKLASVLLRWVLLRQESCTAESRPD